MGRHVFSRVWGMPCDQYPWCIVPNSTAPSPTLDTGPHWTGTSLGPGMEVPMWPLPMVPLVSQEVIWGLHPLLPGPRPGHPCPHHTGSLSSHVQTCSTWTSSYKDPPPTWQILLNLNLAIHPHPLPPNPPPTRSNLFTMSSGLSASRQLAFDRYNAF